MSDETLLGLLAAGLAEVRGLPPTIHATPATPAVAAALAVAEVSRLDALAATGAVVLGVDPGVVRFDERRRTARQRAMFFSAAADEVHRRLAASGVAHVFFKGTVSDPLLFGGRGLRGTSDIDVLVDNLDAAVAALAPLRTGPSIEEGRPRLITLKTSRSMPARIHGADTMIDVQGAWLLSPPLIDDTAGVLARRVHTPGTLPRPAFEDLAAYMGGNLVLDRFSGRLKLALDLALLFARSDVDWSVAVGRARAWRAGGALWALAAFVETHLGIPAPRALLRDLVPTRWRRTLLKASVEGAPIPGALTRALEGDSLTAGARHFVRYMPARLIDYFVDDR